MNYSKLLSPSTIGSVELKNRMVMAPMGSNFCEEDGSCDERLLAYYEERARGGAGLLVVETTSVAWPSGTTQPRMLGLSEDRFLPGLTRLTQRAHQHGAKIAIQLNHGGKNSQPDVAAGRPILVPSIPKKQEMDFYAVLTPEEIATFVAAAGPDGKGPRYQVMTREDIAQVTRQFAEAAARAVKAGFDIVEIHAGHGYMLSSFLSPYANQRDDEYGGSRENRARFLCEVIRAVRATVGPGFPIQIRMDAREYRMPGGIDIEDCIETARLAEQAGADALSISAYASAAIGVAFTEAPLVHQPAGFVPFARAVKGAVSIPVLAVGRIEPELAERGLAAGDFDFVVMGRKLLADPELPNKLAAGKPASIRPCIYCYVCVSRIFVNDAVRCAVNPACGRENELSVIHSTAMQEQHALVIGGGPGGMEAALVLSARGYKVSLWEREKDLGGTMRIAALPYEPNERLLDYLSAQVRASDIAVQTGKTATVEDVKGLRPDVVIVATGANRSAPPIAGKERRHVFDGNELRGLLFGTDSAATGKLKLLQRCLVALGRGSQILRNISALRWLSTLWMPLSKRIVVIGGGLVGLELTEYLVARGREVTVLEPSANLGRELSIIRRAKVIHELREDKVSMHTNATVHEILADRVRFDLEGEVQEVPADNVIIAMGAAPDVSMADALVKAGVRAVAVGDCQEVGYIEGAILSARQAALQVSAGAELTGG